MAPPMCTAAAPITQAVAASLWPVSSSIAQPAPATSAAFASSRLAEKMRRSAVGSRSS